MGILKLICPLARLESVLDVPPQWITKNGFRGVMLDLDNTLVPWNTNDLQPEIIDWVNRLREAGLQVCIVSNSGGRTRVQELAKRLGIKGVTLATKPSRRAFRAALELLQTKPEETLMIGDQMFTDVLGGNRMGLCTLLVRPMVNRDFVLTKFARLLERIFFCVLEKKGLLVTQLTDVHGS